MEQYLRNLYAWGKDYDVKVGEPKTSPIADLLEVPVTVSNKGQSDTATVYISKDGRYMIRGELSDMSADPFAEDRAKLHVGNSPSLGPVDAKVTMIEFADFECPSCRQLDVILRKLLPEHPDVRLVYKYFPLKDLHPWAMTAAIGGQCAYHHGADAFWKMHHAIYDDQDLITPENVWDKLVDFATQEGLDATAFKACMADPKTAAEVQQSVDEGHALNVTATPTTFVNARRVVGPNESILKNII